MQSDCIIYSTEELLEIPAFLDRRNETPEQKAKIAAAWDRALAKQREAAQREQRKVQRKLARQRAAREAEEQAKAERRELREQRAAKRKEKQNDRQAVVKLIRAGHITLGQMVKASSISKDRLSRACRYLLAHKQIEKASARTYRA